MAMFMEDDGWCNKDSESLYVDTYRTKGDWTINRPVYEHRNNDKYILFNDIVGYEMRYATIDEAKEVADLWINKEKEKQAITEKEDKASKP